MNSWQVAREIRQEIDEIKERYRRGVGPLEGQLDKGNERYEIEEAIKHHLDGLGRGK
jgi:hypothetical protein